MENQGKKELPPRSTGATSGTPIVVTVFNQKGGIGKTTSSVNLATCLAAAGWRVALIDVDSQSNATTSLGMVAMPAPGAYHLLKGSVPVTETLQPTRFGGLRVCRADDELAGIGVELALEPNPHSMLRQRLHAADIGVDVVIIDCPPALGLLPINALVASHLAIVPVTPEPMARDGLHRAWRHLQRIRAKLNPHLQLGGVLLTLAREDPIHSALSATLHKELGNRMLAIEVPFDPQVPAAAQHDLPVCVYDPFCAATRAYLALAEGLAGKIRRIALERDGGGCTLAAFDMATARATLRDWRRQASPSAATASEEPPNAGGWLADDHEEALAPEPKRARPAPGLAGFLGFAAGALIGIGLAVAGRSLGWLP